jgi:hypothetical protein
VPYIVAALLAGFLLVAEQHWRQRLWFSAGATAWWAARIAVEAASALALAAALLHVPQQLISLNGIVLGVVAGLAAPRTFGRTQVSIGERNLNPINLAYQRAAQPFDELIDESSAEAQRQYVDDVIRPAAKNGQLNPTEIADAFRKHLGGRHLMREVDRTKRLAFITDIQEDTIPDDEKVALLVLKAWEIGAYKALQDLLKPLPGRRYKFIRSALGRLRLSIKRSQ